jgi:dienelactone hydrolase
MPESTHYFTSMPYLMERFARFGRRLGFRAGAPEEARAWQHELRARVRELLGLNTMLSCPLNPRVTERESGPGYVRERVELQTEPGVTMPLYVLLPEKLTPGQPRPAILAPHGHGSGGKLSPAGREDLPAIRPQIELYNYAYGVQFAQAGWIAFCPDARGFGERRESTAQGEEGLLSSSCHQISHMAEPLGQTVTGMFTWDLMRLLDYVAERPECDPNRIGCAGLSGGGLQTLYLSALDERVRCAVVSGYFYGVKDSLLVLSGNCACNFVPHLWEYADMGDLGALIAPRPLLIETGDQDPLNGERGVPNTTEQVAITRQAYRVLGAEDRLAHDIFEGGHRWHGTVAMEWLRRWLG